MDYQWKIKKNEWDEEGISAHAFFEALRVRFLCEDLLERFPILLEYYVHAEIRQRLAASGICSERCAIICKIRLRERLLSSVTCFPKWLKTEPFCCARLMHLS